MITDASRGVTTYYGLSTDTKPTGDLNGGAPPENSLFRELDTEDWYYFHNGTWTKCGT